MFKVQWLLKIYLLFVVSTFNFKMKLSLKCNKLSQNHPIFSKNLLIDKLDSEYVECLWRHPAVPLCACAWRNLLLLIALAILLFHSQMSNFVDCWLLLKSFCCLLGNFILLCNSLFTAKYFHTYFLAWNRWDEHLHLLNIYCVLELLLWPIQRKANFV